MNNKTLVDLDNNVILRSENIEYDGDTLKNKLNNKYVKLYGAINTKDVFTLNDDINNYDEIHIFASANSYDHRCLCNIYKEKLYSWQYQTVLFYPTIYDIDLRLYDDKIDTTETAIGEDNKHIVSIYGVKY